MRYLKVKLKDMANFKQISIKKVQQFWDKRPCNLYHSSLEIGTKNYFNQVEKRKYFVEPHIPRFAQFAKWKGKKVLEIGCGIGTDTINFARFGAWVTAVDLSGQSLAIAKKRAQVFKLKKRIDFFQANAEKLSETVPIKPYDLIYSFGVIHHTPHPEKVVREIKKYCHKKTVIKIMLYHKYSFKTLWILLKFGNRNLSFNQLMAKYSESQINSPVSYVFSKKEAKKLFWEFKIIDIFVDHIFPYKISDYTKYRYKKMWYFYFMPNFLFRFLEKNFGWHLCLTLNLKNLLN